MTEAWRRPDGRRTTTLLLDADGTLFPSEEPAFAASAGVTNAFLRSLGVLRELTADELRRTTTGLTFRSTAARLAMDHGAEVPPATLESWVEEEVRVVTAHLRDVLQPDPQVQQTLARAATQFDLAVVTSSASPRLDACLRSTELERFFPRSARFSAESSLQPPTTKPDPAIYLHALERLGLDASQAIAVEDSVAGVTAATGAGVWAYGILAFTPEDERAARSAQLVRAGASVIAGSWSVLGELLAEVGGSHEWLAAGDADGLTGDVARLR